jgi:TonB family protein
MAEKLILLLLVAVFTPHEYAASQSTQNDSPQASESQGSASTAKPKSQRVYQVGGDVKAPRIIQSLEPQLDEQQTKQLNAGKKVNGKKVKVTGSATLEIVIGEDGTVRNVAVLESFDHDLDAKAIEAVKQWKFDPATKKGIPVAVELMVKVDFHLYK